MTTPGPSVSGQPTPTTVDLDAIRLRLDQLSQPVPQGAGALWQTRHDRDHAIGTARDLLAELARLRSQLDEARERGDKLQADLERKAESVAYYREMALERGKIMLASEAERDSLREERDRLVKAVINSAESWEQLADEALERRDETEKPSYRRRHEAVAYAYRACSNAARAILAAAPGEAPAEPPPVAEGSALIAATEQQIADALPADDATAAAESAAHAWRQTARILARKWDGPAAPVQPEERHAEGLARLFHETYERLAPDFGYRTREASAKPWEQVPEANRALMVATARHVLGELRAALATAERERDALRLFRVEVAAALDWSDGESDETLLDSLRKNLRLRDAHAQTVNRLAAALAEVAEIADNLDKAEVGSVMTYGDAIAATLRAALGATPDTGSTP